MYQVKLSNRASKTLEKLADGIYERLVDAIHALADNPRPSDCKKLKGQQGYRIRVGEYRVIYDIEDDQLLVFVIDVGHRREIYR
ncbi:type II toxin-antitoxin system RelE/ParE family toxin [Fibrella sp. HMF5036]|uniref:Type II toxin-antitoxin system RelE/ParE family toxin n=1 Tax=Fibrella aquatilis TaxID=2817059 RepID=A0A939GAK3_9BACT|nr:type II toxin-antitoxin system RelE/ParE family toxin [Fibrella aquatilis]